MLPHWDQFILTRNYHLRTLWPAIFLFLCMSWCIIHSITESRNRQSNIPGCFWCPSLYPIHLLAPSGIINVKFKREAGNNHVVKQGRGNTHVCVWKNPEWLKRGIQKSRSHKNMWLLKKKKTIPLNAYSVKTCYIHIHVFKMSSEKELSENCSHRYELGLRFLMVT